MKHFVLFSLCLTLLTVFTAGFAQSNEVSIRTEIFVINQVTGADGAVTEEAKPATTARPGQIVEYRLVAKNETDTTLPAGTVVITGPVPTGTTFVADSATPKSDRILTEYSADGSNFTDADSPILSGTGDSRTVADPTEYRAVRWSLLVPFEPGQEETFVYRVTVNPASSE